MSKRRHNDEENQETEKTAKGKDKRNFFGYQQFEEMKHSDSSEFIDKDAFTEEQWVREKSLRQKKDSLKQYDNNTMFGKCDFNNNDVNDDGVMPVNKPSVHYDDCLDKIAEIDNKKKALSEVPSKPSKNLNSMVSKVASPFATVPTAPTVKREEPKRISDDEEQRKHSSGSSKQDRASVDVWRASHGLDDDEDDYDGPNMDHKDELLDQWLHHGRNNTITEDVEAENADENSSRATKMSIVSNASKRVGQPLSVEDENDDEEENELHKIHMLQSLQALQYLKNIDIPHASELEHMFVFLPPPKSSNLTKTLIFDMDETLIHCVDDIEQEKPQTVLDVVFDDGEVVEAGINVRPYARE